MIGFMKKVVSVKLIDKIEKGEIRNRREKEIEKLKLSQKLLILPPSDLEIQRFSRYFSNMEEGKLSRFLRI